MWLVALEAGPVIPEPKDKQGQKAWVQAVHGRGGIFKHCTSRGGCKDCTQWCLGKATAFSHPPHREHLDRTSLLKSKALCPALQGWRMGGNRARPTEASSFQISLPTFVVFRSIQRSPF